MVRSLRNYVCYCPFYPFIRCGSSLVLLFMHSLYLYTRLYIFSYLFNTMHTCIDSLRRQKVEGDCSLTIVTGSFFHFLCLEEDTILPSGQLSGEG